MKSDTKIPVEDVKKAIVYYSRKVGKTGNIGIELGIAASLSEKEGDMIKLPEKYVELVNSVLRIEGL